jgi:hypothetical protein
VSLVWLLWALRNFLQADIPATLGIFVYRDVTSTVHNIQLSGRLLMRDILCRKSVVSFI